MNKKDLKLQVSQCLNFSEGENNSAYSHLRRLLIEMGVKQPHTLMNNIAHNMEEEITDIITNQIIKQND